MGYYAALGYKLYVLAGTTSSTAPTNTTGMTLVGNLSDCPIQGSSDTQDVIDYSSTQGFKKSVVTGMSYTVPCTMNLDLNDAAYAVLKNAFLNATTQTVQWYRESPEMSATGNPEYHSGVAFVTDFQESIAAGSVATCSFTLTGYGSLVFSAETNT
jgi:hypothetical protein